MLKSSLISQSWLIAGQLNDGISFRKAEAAIRHMELHHLMTAPLNSPCIILTVVGLNIQRAVHAAEYHGKFLQLRNKLLLLPIMGDDKGARSSLHSNYNGVILLNTHVKIDVCTYILFVIHPTDPADHSPSALIFRFLSFICQDWLKKK